MEPSKDAAPATSVAYNVIATERRLDRIGALSDGLFAIAMTIIVLEIRVPALGEHPTDQAVLGALGDLGPRFLTYLLSFLTLGIFWNAQHSQLNYIARGDRHFAWLELAYLAVVALLPFSTSLLAEYIDSRVAFGVYWLNLLGLGVVLFVGWIYAERAGLVDPGTPAHVGSAIRRRIFNYQSLYTVGFLIALTPLGTIPAIVWVVLVQLNAAIAPRILVLWRL